MSGCDLSRASDRFFVFSLCEGELIGCKKRRVRSGAVRYERTGRCARFLSPPGGPLVRKVTNRRVKVPSARALSGRLRRSLHSCVLSLGSLYRRARGGSGRTGLAYRESRRPRSTHHHRAFIVVSGMSSDTGHETHDSSRDSCRARHSHSGSLGGCELEAGAGPVRSEVPREPERATGTAHRWHGAIRRAGATENGQGLNRRRAARPCLAMGAASS